MRVGVRIFGEIASVYGSQHTVELQDGATVSTLTNLLQRRAGMARGGYIGGFRVGGADLAVIVNGRNIDQLDGVKTLLSDGDSVVIMPYVTGG
jgi:MoaD family protein